MITQWSYCSLTPRHRYVSHISQFVGASDVTLATSIQKGRHDQGFIVNGKAFSVTASNSSFQVTTFCLIITDHLPEYSLFDEMPMLSWHLSRYGLYRKLSLYCAASDHNTTEAEKIVRVAALVVTGHTEAYLGSQTYANETSNEYTVDLEVMYSIVHILHNLIKDRTDLLKIECWDFSWKL